MGIFPPTVVPAGFDDRMVLLPNSSRFQSSLPRAFEESFHDQRPIVLLIPRAEHQRHMLLFTLLLQQHQGIGLLSEFLPITDLELPPFSQVLAEPFPQFRARAQFLEP